MRIIETRQVSVHHVEFTADETEVLKELGWFPRGVTLPEPATMWLQAEQVHEWQRVLAERITFPW